MKYLKILTFIDLAAQTVLIGFVLLMGVYLTIDGGLKAILFFASLAAFYLGPLQMFSGIINAVAKNKPLNLRIIHLVVSAIYLSIIAIDDTLIPQSLVYSIPALLAVFYYYITWRSY